MKNSINLLKTICNKVTFFTILFQWVLIAIALQQRGYWEWNGHFASDKILYQLVVLLNIPAITISLPFLSSTNFNSEADTLKDALVIMATITVQWWIIGFFIKQMFFNKKVKVSTDK
ncbi:MAG: hypothetical protein M3T96_10835 [Acidobacteriota bacterium]|nr:hypothetical protein [Acidobacteriota bacterium]